MRHEAAGRHGDTGTPGQMRGNALWGGGKGSLPAALTAVMLVLLALGAGRVQASDGAKVDLYVSPGLLDEAKASPNALFDVIVQAKRGEKASDVASAVRDTIKDTPGSGSALKRTFFSIAGTSATLTGKQLVRLSREGDIESITRDSKVHLTGYTNSQIWPGAANVSANWDALPWGSTYPTIALVDSGVTNFGELGNRFLGNVNLVTTSTNDGAYGHGTFVSTIAAGADAGYAGAEPHAKIISLKVLDGAGVGSKSDVIAACDWILQNKSAYNIRVANFSLNTGGDRIQYDALDKAVEKLWLNGVTVVVAAGNYAVNGAQSNVGYAPANEYMAYLNDNWRRVMDESKKAGLVTEYHVYGAQAHNPNEPDLYLVVTYPNMATFDGLDAKMDPISEKVTKLNFKQADEASGKRTVMRNIMGDMMVRELLFK